MEAVIKFGTRYREALKFAEVDTTVRYPAKYPGKASPRMVSMEVYGSLIRFGDQGCIICRLQYKEPGVIIFQCMDIGCKNFEVVQLGSEPACNGSYMFAFMLLQ